MSADVQARFDRLFGVRKLRPEAGTVGSYRATPEQMEEAQRNWARRIAEYKWRTSTIADFRVVVPMAPETLPDGFVVRRPLPFWPGATLWHLAHAEADSHAERWITLANPGSLAPAHFLDGTANPIRAINKDIPAKGFTSDDPLQEYLVFFCEHVHSVYGGFHIVESDTAEGVPPRAAAREVRTGAALGAFATPELDQLARSRHLPQLTREAATLAHPLVCLGSRPLSDFTGTMADTETVHPTIATIQFGSKLFRALMVVQADGHPTMVIDDEVINAAVQVTAAGWAGASTRP